MNPQNTQGLIDHLIRALPAPRTSGPQVLALCGWADTGKTTLAAGLIEALRQRGWHADGFSTDSFLLPRPQRQALGLSGYDPRSLDEAGLAQTVAQLRQGLGVDVRPYCNRLGRQLDEARRIEPAELIVIEGIHALAAALRPHLTLSLFLDGDDAELAQLRAQANQGKRGMDAAEAVRRIPAELADYGLHVRPLQRHADLVAQVDRDYGYRLLTVATGLT
ncbi:uridine kinase [Inhella inkyongensis]|uniref:Uridine kinase n=1 Tax=Inhella inkyongensis TaxID=392593 RepID=A0A840S8M5_9BURK|nr:hypothetical protein [Inhella inkyongensis]MBB5204780.1 uridine kinase [Inhella inkyongensis]